jgi:lysozyme
MQLTREGKFVIAMEEGLVPTRYRDKVGRDTWGVGHTRFAGAPNPETMSFAMPSNVDAVIKEAIRVYDKTVERYAAEVLKHFGAMAPHELDGWTNWHYNTGGAATSRAAQLWRDGKKVEAVAVLRQWNKVTINGKKQVSKALDKRREVEAGMILAKVYPSRSAGIPVWPTDGKGKVIWRSIDVVTEAEYAAIVGGPIAKAPSNTNTNTAIGAGAIGLAAFVAAFWDKIKELLPWM